MSDNQHPALFRVSNRQKPDSGQPPFFDGDAPGRYYGYFLNSYGEQLIFEYNRETKQATLWHGDAGWDAPYSVVDGQAEDLVLSEDEQLWLRACWAAATES